MMTICPDVPCTVKSTIVRVIACLRFVSVTIVVMLSGLAPAVGQGLESGLAMMGHRVQEAASPLTLTPDMRRWVRRQVSTGAPLELRWRRLAWFLVNSPELRLVETRLVTVTAAEAFLTRRANCVAFAHLAAALAREVGIDVFFVLMRDIEDYEGRGDLRIAYGHLAVGFGPPNKRTVLDLGGLSRPSRKKMKVISDRTALAIFYSNRGAEQLILGDVRAALNWLRAAVELDPKLPRAWVNLGVAERRSGDPDAAARAYHRALEVDPELAVAHENLAVLERREALAMDRVE